MNNLLKFGWHSTKRAAKTQLVMQKTALRWLMGKRPPAPEMLRDTFEQLGTTYVKLGQLVASMPSMFPAEYVEAFQGCLDQTQPLPWRVINKTLIKELGKPDHHFSWICKQPLASASIAQVHAARLHTGEEVVIKVQRPDAKAILTTDLSFMHLNTRVLERIAPRFQHLSLADMVEEIKLGMLEECDFAIEADNMDLYRQFLAAHGHESVKVPRVHRQASTKKVLTMERFFGVPLTDIQQVKQRHAQPENALTDALAVWFDSLRHCRVYHADLHSGNIMMLEDGSIGFIDFGIVGRIPDQVLSALQRLTVALPMQDFSGTAEALLMIGATRASVDVKQLARDIENLYRQEMQVDDININALDNSLEQTLSRLAEIAKRHGIRFPRAFTLLIKQFLYFDRYIQLLAPDMDMFKDERIGWSKTR